MSYRKRVDANHSDVIEALRKSGWRVRDTSRFGDGFPDALAAKGSRLLLVEIKDGTKPPSARKLTADEVAFVVFMGAATQAEYLVVTSIEEAVKLG